VHIVMHENNEIHLSFMNSLHVIQRRTSTGAKRTPE